MILARHELGDGREVLVYELTHGRARLGIGRVGDGTFSDEW